MIRHIVLFKLKDFSSDEERNQAKEDVLANFRALIGEIPQIRTYEVVPDLAQDQTSFDVGINSTFDSLEDIKLYQAHPAHQYAVSQNKQWCIRKVIFDYEFEK